jgi:hypothetical protein
MRENEATNYVWAAQAVRQLHSELGSWRMVADALAPELELSPAAWWQFAQGKRISAAKVNAVLRHFGREHKRQAYARPCIPVALAGRVRASGRSYRELIERGLEQEGA